MTRGRGWGRLRPRCRSWYARLTGCQCLRDLGHDGQHHGKRYGREHWWD